MESVRLDPIEPPAAGAAPPGGPPPGTARDSGGAWLRTLSQEIGRIPTLLGHMRATWELPGLPALDPLELLRHGVRGLVWDVDGTLMRPGDSCVAPVLQPAFVALLGEPRLRHVVVSNCGEARFSALARGLPDVPLLRVYRCGGTLLYRRLAGPDDRWRHGADGSWSDAPPPAVAAAGLRALRKPSPVLMRFALAELGLSDPRAAAVVGDQRLTDVAGAGLAGLRSVKLPTLGREGFPFVVRVLQRAEEAAYLLLYRPWRRGGPVEAAS